MRLALTALLVRDYDEAIDFFTRAVGFELREDSDLGGGKRWVVVGPGGGEAGVLLARAVGEEQVAAVGNQSGGRVMFFLHTDDFDREHARLRAESVQFLEEPRDEPFGKVAVFADLYGNKWDLIEPRDRA